MVRQAARVAVVALADLVGQIPGWSIHQSEVMAVLVDSGGMATTMLEVAVVVQEVAARQAAAASEEAVPADITVDSSGQIVMELMLQLILAGAAGAQHGIILRDHRTIQLQGRAVLV
jgi:hypothetical protein